VVELAVLMVFGLVCGLTCGAAIGYVVGHGRGLKDGVELERKGEAWE
jgi:hypothetical protein